tara:strand:- start:69 stop:854 length:786 start_codon:yes stop_codon:yes gene_type:complete
MSRIEIKIDTQSILSKHYVRDWIIISLIGGSTSFGLFAYASQRFNPFKARLIEGFKSLGRYDSKAISPFEMSMYDNQGYFFLLFVIVLSVCLYKVANAFQLDWGIELLNSISDKFKSKSAPKNINEFQKESGLINYIFTSNKGNEKSAQGLSFYHKEDLAYLYSDGLWIKLDKKNTKVDEPSKILLQHLIAVKIGDFNFKIGSADGTLINKIYKIFKSKTSKALDVKNSPADELKKFKELLDSEAITKEEFDAKKKELLGL